MNTTFEVYSERGFAERLSDGYFNTTANDLISTASEDEAWRQCDALEKLLQENFPTAGAHLEDFGDDGKWFLVDVDDDSQVARILECMIAFRDANDPDASVGVCYILHAPVPVARLTYGRGRLGIEQDPLAWCLDRSQELKLLDGGLEFLSRYFLAADILSPCPWLKTGKHVVLTPPEFWSLVYSGKGFEPVHEKDHSMGYEVCSLMKEAGLKLKSFDRSYLDVSPRFSSHLLVKVECSRSLFDESLWVDDSDFPSLGRWRELSPFASRLNRQQGCCSPWACLGWMPGLIARAAQIKVR